MSGMMRANMRDMSRTCQRDLSRSLAVCAAGIIPRMLREEIIERVKGCLVARGIPQRKWATWLASVGLGRDLIRDWERKGPMPRVDTLATLADELKVPRGWLAYGEGTAIAASMQLVPLVSWVAASAFADPGQVDHLEPETDRLTVGDLAAGRYIALTVVGDSMNMIATDGSVIVIDLEQRALDPRGFYVFGNSEGHATFKRYMSSPPRLSPYSTNPIHEAIEIDSGFQVIGRVVRVLTWC